MTYIYICIYICLHMHSEFNFKSLENQNRKKNISAEMPDVEEI